MPERIIDIGKLHRSHVGLMLGQDNILGLQNPDDCSCNVDLYMAGHGVMKISIRDNWGHFFLHLEGVKYFSGFMWWDSANFRLLSDSEIGEFIKKIGANDISAWIIEPNSSNGKVYIAATKFELMFEDYIPKFVDGIKLP
ncbi:MAG: hypothetical protein KJ043_18735 [Anaerolineae bacterium]|nr:hypothetical protein [Anaerolineae bacterium]